MSNQTFSMYKSEEEMADMEERIPTNGVKDFIIYPDGIYGMVLIKWDDGKGVLPDKLKGYFTSVTRAEKAIKRYVDNHTPQVSMRDSKSGVKTETDNTDVKTGKDILNKMLGKG